MSKIPKRTPRESDEARAQRYAALDAESPTLTPAEYRSQSRRSFLTGAVASVAAFAGFRHLQGRPEIDNIPDVLRKGHEFNEAVWSNVRGSGGNAPTFARSASSMIRVNGRHGIRDEIDLDQWSMRVEGPDGRTLGRHALADVTAFDKVEMTVEHKCIEGWSHVVTWGGTRFSDFVAPYEDLLGELPKYVALETPDGAYYVGMDTASMMHQQTLLAYELEGAPLEQLHGAPLRLATPNKYGIKTIKRIGLIRFSDERPRDYWGERGYDWYAQL